MAARAPVILPRAFISGEDRDDFYRRLNQTVHASPDTSGGYSDVNIPNPNSAMALRGLLQGYAPSKSDLNAKADAVDQANLATYEKEKQKEVSRGDLSLADAHLQRSINSMNISQGRQAQWRPYMQALQDAGVDEIQTGGAAGMDFGPSTYDMKTGVTTKSGKAGFFDTQVPGQSRAYDAREAKWGEMPEDAPFRQQQEQNKRAAAALSGLQGGFQAYDPHAPIELRRRRRY